MKRKRSRKTPTRKGRCNYESCLPTPAGSRDADRVDLQKGQPWNQKLHRTMLGCQSEGKIMCDSCTTFVRAPARHSFASLSGRHAKSSRWALSPRSCIGARCWGNHQDPFTPSLENARDRLLVDAVCSAPAAHACPEEQNHPRRRPASLTALLLLQTASPFARAVSADVLVMPWRVATGRHAYSTQPRTRRFARQDGGGGGLAPRSIQRWYM